MKAVVLRWVLKLTKAQQPLAVEKFCLSRNLMDIVANIKDVIYCVRY